MIGIYDTPDAYICERCGRLLDGNETELSYDDALVCRMCGGEAVPAYRCEVCEEIVPEDEISGYEHNVCRTCIDKKRYDVDFCAKVSPNGDLRGLNDYLARYFTNDEINELMLTALKDRSKIKPIDGSSFLSLYAGNAADLLVEDNKNG